MRQMAKFWQAQELKIFYLCGPVNTLKTDWPRVFYPNFSIQKAKLYMAISVAPYLKTGSRWIKGRENGKPINMLCNIVWHPSPNLCTSMQINLLLNRISIRKYKKNQRSLVNGRSHRTSDQIFYPFHFRLTSLLSSRCCLPKKQTLVVCLLHSRRSFSSYRAPIKNFDSQTSHDILGPKY